MRKIVFITSCLVSISFASSAHATVADMIRKFSGGIKVSNSSGYKPKNLLPASHNPKEAPTVKPRKGPPTMPKPNMKNSDLPKKKGPPTMLKPKVFNIDFDKLPPPPENLLLGVSPPKVDFASRVASSLTVVSTRHTDSSRPIKSPVVKSDNSADDSDDDWETGVDEVPDGNVNKFSFSELASTFSGSSEKKVEAKSNPVAPEVLAAKHAAVAKKIAKKGANGGRDLLAAIRARGGNDKVERAAEDRSAKVAEKVSKIVENPKPKPERTLMSLDITTKLFKRREGVEGMTAEQVKAEASALSSRAGARTVGRLSVNPDLAAKLGAVAANRSEGKGYSMPLSIRAKGPEVGKLKIDPDLAAKLGAVSANKLEREGHSIPPRGKGPEVGKLKIDPKLAAKLGAVSANKLEREGAKAPGAEVKPGKLDASRIKGFAALHAKIDKSGASTAPAPVDTKPVPVDTSAGGFAPPPPPPPPPILRDGKLVSPESDKTLDVLPPLPVYADGEEVESGLPPAPTAKELAGLMSKADTLEDDDLPPPPPPVEDMEDESTLPPAPTEEELEGLMSKVDTSEDDDLPPPPPVYDEDGEEVESDLPPAPTPAELSSLSKSSGKDAKEESKESISSSKETVSKAETLEANPAPSDEGAKVAIQRVEKQAAEEIGSVEKDSVAYEKFLNFINIQAQDLAASRFTNNLPLLPQIGVAAGDASTVKRGFWTRYSNSLSKQRKSNADSAFKSRTNSYSVGFDVETDAGSVLGVAYSNLRSRISTDSSKAMSKSDSVILYGQYQWKPNFGIRSIATYGMANISIRNMDNTGLAHRKTDALGLALSGVYSKRFAGNFILSPEVGVRYNSFKDHKYTGKMGNHASIEVDGKSRSQLNGFVSTKLERIYQFKDNILRPSIHAGFEKALSSSNSKSQARFKSGDIDITKELPASSVSKKPRYNLGGGISVERSNFDCELEYNTYIQQKYKAHQASIKLKLKF